MNTLRLLVLITLLSTSFTLSAQEKPKANVRVIVTDYNDQTKKGETIIFENTATKASVSGVSDEKGEFETQLPSGETYLIKIKGVGNEQDYTQMEVPTLKKGQTMTFTVNVQFEPPKTFTLDRVHFQSGKATLTKSSFKELNELLEYLQLKDNIVVEIAGHTDDVGEEEANLKLSQKRAESVRNFLISKGISAERVRAKGYGEAHPVSNNSTPEGRQMNRRTEVRILSE